MIDELRRRRWLLPLLLALSCRSQVHGRQEPTFWLDLLETTDLHGHVEAMHVPLHDEARALERGGLARLAGYVANARRHNPGHVVLVDAGDAFQGTLVSNLGEGDVVVQAMNALGYATLTAGNHEFDFGPGGEHVVPLEEDDDPRGALRRRVAESRFAWLATNVVDAQGLPLGIPGVRRHVVIDVDGVRVGIVGGTTMDTMRTTIRPNLAGLHIEPLDRSVSRAAAQARSEGATVVVAVVHAGGDCHFAREANERDAGNLAGCDAGSELFRLARSLAELARDGKGGRLDALFGGHTHHAVSAVVAGIPVAQSVSEGLGLARISLEVDRTSRRPTGRFRVIPPVEICAAVFPGSDSCDPRHAAGRPLVPASYLGQPVVVDGQLEAILAPFLARAAARRAEPVGVRLDSPFPRSYSAESPLVNFVADAIRRATRADLAIMNGGGVREALPQGELTYGELFQALPFENRLATLRLRGSQLKRLLAANFSTDKGMLGVSGIHVRARCQAGALVLGVSFDDGRPFEDARLYSLGTNDFLALGGDDFSSLVAAADAVSIDEQGPLLRDVVARELAAHGGQLRVGDPEIYDPRRPRIALPRPRPLRCPH